MLDNTWRKNRDFMNGMQCCIGLHLAY